MPQQGRKRLRRRRMGRSAHETASQHLKRLEADLGPAPWLEALGVLARLFERGRYGLGPVGSAEVVEATGAAQRLRRELRRWRRRRR